MGDRAYSHREGLVNQTWFGNSETVWSHLPSLGLVFTGAALNSLQSNERLLPRGGGATKGFLPLSQVEIGFADPVVECCTPIGRALSRKAKTSDWCQGNMVILPAVSSVGLVTLSGASRALPDEAWQSDSWSITRETGPTRGGPRV